jgi:phosphoglycerate dehydrogenase-like enzyme
MQIYVHNRLADAAAPITRTDWDRVCGRLSRQAELSIGSDPGAFHARAAGVEVLVASPLGLRELMPFSAPRLKIIFVTWAGLDRLAPYDWLPTGVALLNNSGAHALKAAEYVVMAMLMLVNGIPSLVRAQAAQRWLPAVGRTLAGRHVVVVGLGAIGGAAATLAQRLGMRVTGVRATPRPHPACEVVVGVEDLDALLPRADFVALALPHSAMTERLLDRRRLSLLPSHAGIVNVGRGQSVEEGALCDLLDAGRLGGAVLDVFESEPLPPGHRAWTTPNLVVTPHMSADDPDTVTGATLEILVDNLNAFAQGAPLPNEFDVLRGTRVRA